MNCPKCGFEQPDGTIECSKCGVIIAKALNPRSAATATPPRQPVSPPRQPAAAAPAPAPAPASSVPPQAQAMGKSEPMAVFVFVLFLALAAAWWINSPLSAKVPAGLQVYKNDAFALSAPNWGEFTREKLKDPMFNLRYQSTGSNLPNIMGDLFAKNPTIKTMFVKLSERGEVIVGVVGVIVEPLARGLRLDDAEKDKLVDKVVQSAKNTFPNYQMDSASLVEVDGLTALQVTGSSAIGASTPAQVVMGIDAAGRERGAVGVIPEVKRTLDGKVYHVLVPGNKYAYLIEGAGSAEDITPVFKSVVDSFRVMDRPARFGKGVRTALNICLFGLCAYLTYQLVVRALRREAKK